MAIIKTQMKQSEFVRNVWCIKDATVEDVLKPEFFVHTGQYLKAGDKIELIPNDMSFYAELLVVSCGKQWAKVKVIVHQKFDGPVKKEEKYSVNHNPKQGWRVVRLSDKEVLSKDHPDRESAELWLYDFKKKVE